MLMCVAGANYAMTRVGVASAQWMRYRAGHNLTPRSKESAVRVRPLVLGLLALVLSVTAGRASVVEAPTLQQMVDRADRIFVGQVVDVRSYRTGTSIHTDVTFRTSDVVKGAESPMVVLTFLGGTVGEDTLEVSGMPKFAIGDEQVVFAVDAARQMSPIVGLWHGRVRVSRDLIDGTARVLRNDGTPFERSTAVSEKAAATSDRVIMPMRLDAFLRDVRQLARAAR
jgi:hypothetical protein